MFVFMNSKSSLALLKFLITNGGELHVREISRQTGMSLGFVSRVLRQLHKDGLISAQRRGRMVLYRVDHANVIVKQIKVLLTVTELYPLIKKFRTLTRRVILFGSAARGENMPDSDIDLFIMTNHPSEVRLFIRKHPRVVSIIMQSTEYANLKKTDFALYDQINRGIALWEESE